MSEGKSEGRVLVVEDSVHIRFQLKRLLTHPSGGISETEIDFANNKEEALALIAKHQYLISILDVNLGENDGENRDGIDIAEAIKGSELNSESVLINISDSWKNPHIENKYWWNFKKNEMTRETFVRKVLELRETLLRQRVIH